MDLEEIVIFTKVVQAGSFTRAARELATPKSTVSRKVSDLEARLGARLLQRTTRKLGLTDAGRVYFEHGARIAAELDAAQSAVSRMQSTPSGQLRVTAPLHFGFLGAIVAELLEAHPRLSVELVCTDRIVDLVAEGFDLAIRAGAPADSSLVRKKLAESPRLLVASAGYLARRGRPRAPADLAEHECALFGAGRTWALSRAGKTQSVAVSGRIAANDLDVVMAAVIAGRGIAIVPDFLCGAPLADGRLEQVLPDWTAPSVSVSALYPSTRHLAPKVAAFLELLARRMSPPPWRGILAQ
jgi:DNA-binding transcriptional LysR family regulator